VVGARVRLCDVNPDTLDVDPDVLRAALDTDVGAVVLGNLFGWPSVTPTALARSVGALVIDDAAQALGARERNLLVGERGDLAILSLGRGKCLTVGDAGVLLVHRAELTDLAREFRPAGRAGSLKPWVTALAVRAASWPWVFGVGTRAGIGNVGESTYTPAFGRRRVARSAEGLAARLGERAQWLAAERARVAEQWRNALQHAPVSFPVVRTGTAPAYLRFPVLVQDPLTREVIVERLSRVGLSHVLSYPTPLNGIAPFRVACCEDGPPTPGAAALASRLLALPCHRGVTPSVMRRATAMVTAVAPAERIQGRHDAESAADSAAGT
jgi:dTDP-4-amino-4,6-dideoxygalactose transaminase